MYRTIKHFRFICKVCACVRAVNTHFATDTKQKLFCSFTGRIMCTIHTYIKDTLAAHRVRMDSHTIIISLMQCKLDRVIHYRARRLEV